MRAKKVRRKVRKVPAHERYGVYVIFVTHAGGSYASLEHEGFLPEILESMTYEVGGIEHYFLSYPHRVKAQNAFTAIPEREDFAETPSQAVMFPCSEVARVWLQAKGRN